MDTIPDIISDNEILVRFVFDSHFKNKNFEIGRIKGGDVFLDTRGSVSLQRYLYCDDNQCREYAYLNASKTFIGFLSFKKSKFEETVFEHRKSRAEFEAEIISTKQENPSHADLIYRNPALRDDESENSAIRLFSRMLFKVSNFIFCEAEKTIGCDYND